MERRRIELPEIRYLARFLSERLAISKAALS